MTDRIEATKERARVLEMMITRAEELGKVPVKNDFTEDEIHLIKDNFGPFPRALEAAGLKEVTAHYKEKIKRKKNKIK